MLWQQRRPATSWPVLTRAWAEMVGSDYPPGHSALISTSLTTCTQVWAHSSGQITVNLSESNTVSPGQSAKRQSQALHCGVLWEDKKQ